MTTAAARQAAQNHGALRNGDGEPAGIFDLDAYQAEAMHEPFPFTLGGEKFELLHLSDVDWHAVLGDDANPDPPTVHKMLRAGLGDQWDAFTAHKLTSGGYNELWRRWQEHSGTDPGESGASPAS